MGICLVILGICLVIFSGLISFPGRQVQDAAPVKKPSFGNVVQETQRKVSKEVSPDISHEISPRIAGSSNQLESPTGPLNQNFFTSTVDAELMPGETLVTGGYKRDDGNYELTLVTPQSFTLEDGTEGIRVESKVIWVPPKFLQNEGLENLATRAKNVRQHGETRTKDEVSRILFAGSNYENVGLMTVPSVVLTTSDPTTLEIGHIGSPRYSLEISAKKTEAGNFAVQCRIERVEETKID